MTGTVFARILKKAVDATPHAIGGAFADRDGEMVDSFATIDTHDWAVLTAHYGIILAQLDAAFGTWHFGGPEYFVAQHEQIEIVVHAVEGGYYALLALRGGGQLAVAIEVLRAAACELRKEMR